MKRNNFLKHLKQHNCTLLREGGRHSLYINPDNGKQSSVPRHPEVSDLMCKIICKQLGIPIVK